jgi:type II secretory pathway component PulL
MVNNADLVKFYQRDRLARAREERWQRWRARGLMVLVFLAGWLLAYGIRGW